MKFKKLKISARSTKLFATIKNKTGLTPNILSRFAICISLKERPIPNPDEYDDYGSEIAPAVLFGEHEQLYLALMINRLKNDGLDVQDEDYLTNMTRAHLNRGAIALGPRINDLSDFYELVKEERNV